MKYGFLAALLILGSQSAHAGLRTPYKKISIDCEGGNQSLQMQWDFSKCPYICALLINGKNEALGMIIKEENGSTSYSKQNLFSVVLNKEDDKMQFAKTVTIGNEPISMNCKQSSSWHVLESE